MEHCRKQCELIRTLCRKSQPGSSRLVKRGLVHGVRTSKSLEGNTLGSLFHPTSPDPILRSQLGERELVRGVRANGIIE